ncbi:hypothetical protein JR316_0002729 [Psilocybe cubensis]|uniref:Uncharacterized protein n=2 Tax=Psilocybe cubensis TaxID=181762 RepID=A0A8H7Y8H1_PSICU|nr:hypothetical protein JR316_0002729 [Psilocybe cubensis]KAH9485814.1 hypothetical protein JR316_0002729 [Psilocybe cubensis]
MSLFSVSKLLGKSRAKTTKRAPSEATRSNSLLNLSIGEKEKNATPKSSTIFLPTPPTTTISSTTKLEPNTDLESVLVKEPSPSPPPVVSESESIEIIPPIVDSQTRPSSVEEPGYTVIPEKKTGEVAEGAEFVAPLQPEARSSETEWTELEATKDDRNVQEKTFVAEPLDVDNTVHEAAQNLQQDAEFQHEHTEVEPVKEVITAPETHEDIQLTLKIAQEEIQAKSRIIEELLAQTETMGVEIARLSKEKEILIEEAMRQKESLVEETMRDKQGLVEAARHEKEELLEEIDRLKGIIGVERHDARQQLASFDRQKTELHAQLVAQEENIVQLEMRLAEEQEKARSQEMQISRLEGRLVEGREEVGAVYTRTRDLELLCQRYQDEIAEERSRVAEKESHIRMVEKNNENLASQLVHLQSNLNEAERQNRMFIDQLRRQSNELQASKNGSGLASSSVTRFAPLILGRALMSGPSRIESAISTIKMLNEEIFQTAAAMTDQLENIPKRFVVEDESASAKAEILKSMLGLELVRNLQEEAQIPSEEHNPLFVQTALQGCLTASCLRIITSWYPAEWEYGNFLYALYERIRGTGGPEIASIWKKATQQSCVPSTDRNAKLVTYLTEQIQAVLTVCGWSQQSAVDEMLRDKYSRNLAGMVSQAVRLNTLTMAGEGRDLEAILIDAGKVFDPRCMQNENPFESASRKLNVTAPPDEEVVCTTALGLKTVQSMAGESEQILLMPKVFLNAGLL